MACNVEEIQGLMELAAFLLIVIIFSIAGAYRWANSQMKE